ncbi:Beta-TrCP [Dactylella cylindrospora]|nr:Beta-TrCP [Dactylella cylindrospora]
MIHDAPLQLYASALLFSPEGSPLKEAFKSQVSKVIRRRPTVRKNWPAILQSLLDHSDAVNSVRFSPDGRKLISSSHDKTVRVWNSATGELQETLEGHSETVNFAAFSPTDPRLIASVGNDRTVRLWNEAELTAALTLEGHNTYVNTIAFSPDGTQIASSADDIRIRDAETGALLKVLRHEERSIHIAYSPNGKKLVSASWYGGYIRIWDVATWTLLFSIHRMKKGGHVSEQYGAVAFSLDGKYFATLSASKVVKMWDPDTGKEVREFSQSTPSSGGVFSPDGSRLAWRGSTEKVVADATKSQASKIFSSITRNSMHAVAYSSDGTRVAGGADSGGLWVWDIDTGDLLIEANGHKTSVRSADFSSDGSRLATASDDSVRIWNTITGRIFRQWNLPNAGYSSYKMEYDYYQHCIVLSVDGHELVSGSSDNILRWWDVETGKMLNSVKEHSESIRAIARSPDGATLATGAEDRSIKVWDWKARKVISTLEGHADTVRAMSFSPDGAHLASCADSTIGLWDTATGTLLRTLALYCPVHDVSFSPDGERLASAMFDGSIQLLDAQTLLSSDSDCQSRQSRQISITSLTFSPKNNILAAVQSDHSIRFVDTATSEEVRLHTGHNSAINSAVFSTCSTLLATASDDHTVKLWSLVTSHPILLQTLEGHESWVRCVAFSPSTDMLASGADDYTVRIWSVPAGKLLYTVADAHKDWIRAVAFSPNGKLLASASDDKTVRLWNIAAATETVEVTLVHSLEGHTGWVRALSFSGEERDGESKRERPERLRLASAAADGTIRIWDIENGKELDVIKGVEKGTRWIRFSQDGQWLETGGGQFSLEGGAGGAAHRSDNQLVYVKEDWIYRGDKRLLHIPEEYRPTSSAYDGNGLLALGHLGGLVSFYEFN